MPILVIGLNHHQVSADELLRFTAGSEQAVAGLRTRPGIRGTVLLATCNRCEFYVDAERFHPAVNAAGDLLAAAGARDLFELAEVHAERSAVEHLFQVACGLDSMVVGESEIAGQVRGALAASNGFASPPLHRLFQTALATSKLVARTTTLSAMGRSIASVALDLVESRHGRLDGRDALLIGTGSYAGVVTADLTRRGARIAVHSGSGRAVAFARTHPVTPLDPEEVPQAIARAGVIVSCSGMGAQPLSAAEVVAARQGVFDMLPVVDLALARDVAVDLAETPGVDLIDLDEVGRNSPGSTSEAVAAAHRAVNEGVDAYLANEQRRLADPVVTALRAHVNQIVAAEIADVNAHQPPEVAAAITRSLHRVANTLLHAPSLRATESAQAGGLGDYQQALETVFGIEVGR